ncbi:hypothetical protein E0I03_01225 [Dickeya dadantii]|uniref:Uncharacterized protein n=1 Tax=Dickeya dadantii (strain 3937) TaxID=198628 RepID=E0SBB5_DICD3|nr:hypothetical protein [Dickeya dadantii]ADM98384.1 hypothetical protein Dda3937_03329 [Dickeya dadantii 3937]NPE49857.1 hypothetical protein [Dickeya dadantii]
MWEAVFLMPSTAGAAGRKKRSGSGDARIDARIKVVIFLLHARGYLTQNTVGILTESVIVVSEAGCGVSVPDSAPVFGGKARFNGGTHGDMAAGNTDTGKQGRHHIEGKTASA